MVAVLPALAHDVEEEGVHVVVQRLVVQEELGEQAQILAVHLRAQGIELGVKSAGRRTVLQCQASSGQMLRLDIPHEA